VTPPGRGAFVLAGKAFMMGVLPSRKFCRASLWDRATLGIGEHREAASICLRDLWLHTTDKSACGSTSARWRHSSRPLPFA
jgi:hypothetical protein